MYFFIDGKYANPRGLKQKEMTMNKCVICGCSAPISQLKYTTELVPLRNINDTGHIHHYYHSVCIDRIMECPINYCTEKLEKAIKVVEFLRRKILAKARKRAEEIERREKALDTIYKLAVLEDWTWHQHSLILIPMGIGSFISNQMYTFIGFITKYRNRGTSVRLRII